MYLAFSGQKQVRCEAGQSQGSWRVICTCTCFWHQSDQIYLLSGKTLESTHGQPASCRARPVNTGHVLQNRMWVHGPARERLPAMSYALCPNLNRCLFLSWERDRYLSSSVFYTRTANVFSQTPGRRSPHITGLRVSSVTLMRVEAPNERAPFRFHDAIAVYADRGLMRTRIDDQRFGGGS